MSEIDVAEKSAEQDQAQAGAQPESKPKREIPVPPLQDREQAKRIIEALLFVSSEPLTLRRITYVIPELQAEDARAIIAELALDYSNAGRAYALKEIAGGYQLKTDATLAPWMQRALHQAKPASVSRAALETLAIVAYRQPLTKAEIEAIRGVDSSAALEALLERGFVQMVGRKDSPGRPFLYGTTSEFLRHFGLKSLQALPKPEFNIIQEPQGDEPVDAQGAPAEEGPAEGTDGPGEESVNGSEAGT